MTLIRDDERVARWVAERAPIEKPDFVNFVGLGIVRSDGVLAAGLVFSDWQPPCRRIELSGAVDDPHAVGTRIIAAIGDYVFGQLNVYRIHAKTSKDNPRALRFLEGIGFIREGTLASFYGPDRHAVTFRMLEPEWTKRWGSIALEKAA